MKKENPGKSFYPAKDLALCQNMKKITLDKVLFSLENMVYRVDVDPEVREKAREAIEKMIRL